jgi:CheY-like chemotaxis protein
MWVLQIDDDQDDLELFGEAVTLFDPNVKYFGLETIEDALAYLKGDGVTMPDVIFLDINMPRHSGFDCYKIFKQDSRFAHTRFVFLSTAINQKEIPPGCDSMLKQYSVKTYVAMLKNLLSSPVDVSRKNTSIRFELHQAPYVLQSA